MFDSLSDRLQGVFRSLRGEARLTEQTVEAALRLAAPGYERSGALAPSEAFEPEDFLGALASAGVEWEVEAP